MISKAIDKTINVVGVISAIVLVLLVSIILYDASMRYLFSQGSILLQELEWHLFDIIMLLSIPFTLKYNRHVRVDIFYQNYTEGTKEIVDFVGYLFMIIPFSVLVMYVSYDFILQSIYPTFERSANPDGLPFRFLIRSFMFIGFTLLGLQAVSKSLHFIAQSRGEK